MRSSASRTCAVLCRSCALVGEVLPAAAAAGAEVRARRLDAVGALLQRLDGDGVAVASLDLGDARAHAVARAAPGRRTDDEAVEARDATPPERASRRRARPPVRPETAQPPRQHRAGRGSQRPVAVEASNGMRVVSGVGGASRAAGRLAGQAGRLSKSRAAALRSPAVHSPTRIRDTTTLPEWLRVAGGLVVVRAAHDHQTSRPIPHAPDTTPIPLELR